MYLKLVTKVGFTAQEFANDMILALTGGLTATSQLTAAVTASCELVVGAAPQWGLVHKITDTPTRCHFVLTAFDNGGVEVTLGVIVTTSGGDVAVDFWMCGGYNAATKKPKAYDMTGFDASTPYPASSLAEGGNHNGFSFLGQSYAIAVPVPMTIGPTDGTLTLVLSSIVGNTMISRHVAATHEEVLEVYMLDRALMGRAGDIAIHPWPLVAAFAFRKGGYAARSVQPGVDQYGFAPSGVRGHTVCYVTAATIATLTGTLATELGHPLMHPQGYIQINTGVAEHAYVRENGYLNAQMVLSDRNTQLRVQYSPTFCGLANHNASYRKEAISYPKYCPSYVEHYDGSSSPTATFPYDEITAGADTWVSIGASSAYSRCHYKG